MLSIDERRAAIEQIAARNNGRVLPEAVVEEARAPEHVLHGAFDWNDATAAHQQRLDVARAIIRAVRIHITTTHRIINSIAYVRDPNARAREQGSVPIIEVRKSQEDSLAVLNAELGRIQAMIDRGQEIAKTIGLEDEFWKRLSEMTSIRPSRRKAA